MLVLTKTQLGYVSGGYTKPPAGTKPPAQPVKPVNIPPK